MNSPSVDVKDVLETYGDSSSSGTYDFGTNLFVSFEPDSPDRCITLLDTGGLDPDTVATYERPTMQIRSRDVSDNYRQAYASIKAIIDILHGNRFTINSTTYVFWQQGDIFYLGRDEKNRVLLTANMRMNRHP